MGMRVATGSVIAITANDTEILDQQPLVKQTPRSGTSSDSAIAHSPVADPAGDNAGRSVSGVTRRLPMRTPLPQPSSARIAILGALLGAFASAYLLVDYVFGSGICLTGSGCDIVRASAFAYPLGIPMPLLGLGFYLAALVLVLAEPMRVFGGRPIGQVAVAWALGGVAVMAVLTAVEAFVIAAWCSWCLLSTVASLVLAGGAIATRRGADATQPSKIRSSRARRRQGTLVEQSRHELRRFAAASGGLAAVAFAVLLAVPALTGAAPSANLEAGATDRPSLGSGPVEVVVYSDFQCPACAAAAPELSRLAGEGSATVEYRYFPLVSIHANATAAAQAAQAAALQGDFWPFHDALFARQASWADLSAAEAFRAFESIASDLGLDVARWQADAASSEVTRVVAADRLEAERMQLSGTPTIFVDAVRHRGPFSYGALLDAVRAAED
jgi:protein-disulfide isomerase/uncharacterized membrane protein